MLAAHREVLPVEAERDTADAVVWNIAKWPAALGYLAQAHALGGLVRRGLVDIELVAQATDLATISAPGHSGSVVTRLYSYLIVFCASPYAQSIVTPRLVNSLWRLLTSCISWRASAISSPSVFSLMLNLVPLWMGWRSAPAAWLISDDS